MAKWSKEEVENYTKILGRSPTVDEALATIRRETGVRISRHELRRALLAYRDRSPSEFLGGPTVTTPSAKEEERRWAKHDDPLVQKLMTAIRKKDASFRDLCDQLDLSPKKLEELLDAAMESGFQISVNRDRIGMTPKTTSTPSGEWELSSANFAPGEEQRIAVISDIHFGSKYCLREQVRSFVTNAYRQGIREIFCPGDLLEGCYKHARFELSAVGWDEQAAECLDYLPELEGLTYHYIDGNHDGTWTQQTGLESGKGLLLLSRDRGRKDLHYYGERGATLNYGGTRIGLWHPKKGLGYARSYQLQTYVRDVNPKRIPDLLFAGHWHRYVKFRQQNVWSFASGTFQHPDSAFGKSLGSDVELGGLIVRWRKDSDGEIRHIGDEFHTLDYEIRTQTVGESEG